MGSTIGTNALSSSTNPCKLLSMVLTVMVLGGALMVILMGAFTGPKIGLSTRDAHHGEHPRAAIDGAELVEHLRNGRDSHTLMTHPVSTLNGDHHVVTAVVAQANTTVWIPIGSQGPFTAWVHTDDGRHQTDLPTHQHMGSNVVGLVAGTGPITIDIVHTTPQPGAVNQIVIVSENQHVGTQAVRHGHMPVGGLNQMRVLWFFNSQGNMVSCHTVSTPEGTRVVCHGDLEGATVQSGDGGVVVFTGVPTSWDGVVVTIGYYPVDWNESHNPRVGIIDTRSRLVVWNDAPIAMTPRDNSMDKSEL